MKHALTVALASVLLLSTGTSMATNRGERVRERWNANPQARARLFEHAQRWRQLTPEQRMGAHHGFSRWERMDPQQRQTMRALFKQMRSLPPEQRRALRERWRAMSPGQRRAWVAENSPSGN